MPLEVSDANGRLKVCVLPLAVMVKSVPFVEVARSCVPPVCVWPKGPSAVMPVPAVASVVPSKVSPEPIASALTEPFALVAKILLTIVLIAKLVVVACEVVAFRAVKFCKVDEALLRKPPVKVARPVCVRAPFTLSPAPLSKLKFPFWSTVSAVEVA